MSKVIISGNKVDFDAAVNLMDDELIEALHSSQEWESNQAFADAYVVAHAEKFDGEEFVVA